MHKKSLVIAATSARAYAQAVVASGYESIVLDAFADADTSAVAKQTFRLKMQDLQLDAEDFKRTFSTINLDKVDGFLYGSLFDDCPELLDWVAHRIRLVGNTPEVLKKAKDFSFFKLLDDLQVVHPKVSLKMPSDQENWLCKRVGGNGGMHVRPASQARHADYFQFKLAGKPISMLFVADSKKVHKIGFNQQFISPTDALPYRYAGAVGGVNLPTLAEEAFCNAAQKLTTALGLRGICSLDAILDGDTLWILELNPRLSASFELYPNLLKAHLQGCEGELPELFLSKSSRAQMIVYADKALEIKFEHLWPDWVRDIPVVDSKSGVIKIAKNWPICSVVAEAPSAMEALQLVKERAKECAVRLC